MLADQVNSGPCSIFRDGIAKFTRSRWIFEFDSFANRDICIRQREGMPHDPEI